MSNQGRNSTRSRREGRIWQVVPGLAALLLCGWAYWPTLLHIAQTWAKDPDYTHGYLVVPLSVFLLWLRAGQRPPVRFGFHAGGLLLLLLAAVLRYLAARLYLRELDAWSIPLWLGGTCWTFYGRKVMRWVAPSVAFLWFATPMPGTVAYALSIPLQKVAASCSTVALQLFGQPAVVQGTTILLRDLTLEVERACSGLRMFYGITALAFAVILIARSGFWKSTAILAVVVPVAILVNSLRITVTGLMATRFSSETIRHLTHDLAAVVVLPLAILFFLGLLWLVNRISRSWQARSGRTAKRLLATFVACLPLVLVVSWWYGIQHRRSFATLLAAAHRYEQQHDWVTAVEYLSRYTLARPDDTAQRVHLAEAFSKLPTTPATALRAAHLLYEAYQLQPQRRDLAIQAVDQAVRARSYRFALRVLKDVKKTASDEADGKLDKKEAKVLLAYLCSPQGATQAECTWEDAARILARVVDRDGGAIKYAVALALVTRQYLAGATREERIAEADSWINRLIADEPDDPEAWFARYRYASLYWADNRCKDRDADLDQAVKMCRVAPPETQVEILLAAARRARLSGSPEQAREYLEQAIAARPHAVEPYLALADIEQQSGDLSGRRAAITVLRQGMQATDGQSMQLALALAQALVEVGDGGEAETVLSPLRAMLPRVIDGGERAYLRMAIALVESVQRQHQGKLLAAVRTLDTALQHPETGLAAAGHAHELEQAWLRLGQLYTSLGRPDQALGAARQAVGVNPGSSAARKALADAALMAADVTTAVRENLRRVRRQPDAGDAWVALAVAQLRQQLLLPPNRRRFSSVRRSLAHASKLPSSNVPLLLARVDLLRAENRRGAARQLLEQSLRKDAEQPELWLALAFVRLELGDLEAALTAAEQITAKGGDPLDDVAMRVRILIAMDHRDEAMQLVDKSQRLWSEQRPLQAARLAATFSRRLGHDQRAYSILERAHDTHPGQLAPLEQLARYAWQDQDWNQLAGWEKKLEELEGADGTQWKTYRVLRLLATQPPLDREATAEMAKLTREIDAVRPRWATSQYLLAQVALRRGETDEAIQHLGSAWRGGERSPAVAEQLLDLLNQAGRTDEADRYAAQFSTMPLTSPGLFDRLLPSLFDRGWDREALAQARRWVQDNPRDARALVRLARTLLVLASKNEDGADRARRLTEAEQAFCQSVRLAPADVSTWSSLFAFYLQTQRPEAAVKTLDRFEQEVTIDPVQKELVLARLNGIMRRTVEATRHWRHAAQLAANHQDAATRVSALSQAAEYFAPISPALSERYCRQALQSAPKARRPLELLIRLLAVKSKSRDMAEAFRLLDQLPDEPADARSAKTRLTARLLAQRGATGDVDRAIRQLKNLPSLEADDKLLLAQLYGDAKRIAAGYELLNDLVSSPAPRARDLVAYLEFCQRHFQTERAFRGRQQEVLRRLGHLPDGTAQRLRWELRLTGTAAGEQASRASPAASVLERFWALPDVARAQQDERSSQSLLLSVLRVLLEQGYLDQAVHVCRQPPSGISPQFAARLLANALMARGLEDEDQVAAGEGLLAEALKSHPDDVLLLQDAADLAALCGKINRATKLYERILAIDASNRPAKSNLLALMNHDPRQRREALGVVERALAEDPDDGALLDIKGLLLLSMDRARDAIKVLSCAADVAPTRASVHLHLAMVRTQLGQRDAAEEAIVIALALGVDREPLAPPDRQSLAQLRGEYDL